MARQVGQEEKNMLRKPVVIVAILALSLAQVAPAAATVKLSAGAPAGAPAAGDLTMARGDVFVSVGSGKVQWRLPDGTLQDTLDTGAGGFTTGLTFDRQGLLYVTDFSGNRVFRFDERGDLLGQFGSGFNCQPESILFDAAGNAFVGQAGCSDDVLKFDPAGNPLATFNVPIEDRGSDWIDLEPDQCTLRYTSEGNRVLRYDVCQNQPLPDFAGGLGVSYALRMLPDGSLLVANTGDIRMLAPDGSLAQSYDVPGENCWFALNLDPDGASFWSADFCTSNVYRFNTATGQVITSFNTGTPTSTVFGLAVRGEITTSGVRDCNSEDVTRNVIAPEGPGERVTVRYDERYLVDPGRALASDDARRIAMEIKARAESTLDIYEDLEFPTPISTVIDLVCQITFLGVVVDPQPPAMVESAGKVRIRTDLLQQEFHTAVSTDFAGDAWKKPPAGWVSTVDHELFHTVQYSTVGATLWGQFLQSNHTAIESGPMLAQDLVPDGDDIDGTPSFSYLESVDRLFTKKTSVDVGATDRFSEYESGAIYQYLGERFGPQDQPRLERRVAKFLGRIVNLLTIRMSALRDAVAGQPFGFGPDVYDAIRDFWVAAAIHDAPNVAQYPRFVILDDFVPNPDSGQATAGEYPAFEFAERDLRAAAVDEPGEVAHAAAQVYRVRLPDGATEIAVGLDTESTDQGFFGDRTSPARTAIVLVEADNTVEIRDDLLGSGPRPDQGLVETQVPVAGKRYVYVVVVASEDIAKYRLTIGETGGNRQLAVTETAGAVVIPVGETLIPIEVRSTRDGSHVPGIIPSSFTVTVAGQPVDVERVDPRPDRYIVLARLPQAKAEGTYSLVVSDGAAQDSATLRVVGPEPGHPPEPSTSASLGTLGEGQSGSMTVPVTPGTSSTSFEIEWSGSDFDLRLESPSGRVITETTIAADVLVERTPISTRITVTTPEAGDWDVRATGVDVPDGPEPVSLLVNEHGAAVRSAVYVDGAGQAGLPMIVRFGVSSPAGPISGSTAIAEVTDPGGTVRSFDLSDGGGPFDAAAGDGVFAAEIWGTAAAGRYEVAVRVVGLDGGGAAFARTRTAENDLLAMTDGDGDGVADGAEARFGLNPAVADGDIDHDGDGLHLRQELAAGSDPWSWDTDGGGEADRSELAAGRAPAARADDVAFPSVVLSANPRDGRLVEASVATIDGTARVHLFRLEAAGAVDLGIHPGSGASVVDGPLPAGQYGYMALAVSDAGDESAPVFVGPVTASGDTTAPRARITVNGGAWETSEREVSIVFSDLSEAVTDMRIAESLEALAAAPWVPFSGTTEFQLGPALGEHRLYAQVRDASGNESGIAYAVVELIGVGDTTPPESSVTAVTRTTGSDVSIAFTATDDDSAVDLVEIWSRHRATATAAWSSFSILTSGAASPLTATLVNGDGEYEFYSIAVDSAGNRETPPATADAGLVIDTTAPTSQALALIPTTTADFVDVSYTATDALTGVAAVELWVRYQRNEIATWSEFTLAATSTASPIRYTFTDGDGFYEFYTVAVDGVGNREAEPDGADTGTRREAVDDPPDMTFKATASKPATCHRICPRAGPTAASVTVTLNGSGTALDDRSPVTVSWRLWGVKSDGSRKRLFDFIAATPSDGSFNTRSELYRTTDQRPDAGYLWYDVEVRVVAGLQTTIRTFRIEIKTTTGIPA